MKKLLTTLTILILTFSCTEDLDNSTTISTAEEELQCGIDEPTASQEQFIQQMANNQGKLLVNGDLDLVQIKLTPLKIHNITDGDLSENEINDAIDIMNQKFAPSGIEFYICGGINVINGSEYTYFSRSEESALRQEHYVDGIINVFVANTVISSSGSSLCGYAYYPNNNPFTILKRTCFTNGSTLAHEMGHVYALPHTHGYSNSVRTNELVDGSNCTSSGDYICDTPADPKLGYGNVNSSCSYVGTLRDANNDLYEPDANNLMSYSRKECRDGFTTLQLERIAMVHDIWYADTTCDNAPNPPTPVTKPQTEAGCYATEYFNYVQGKQQNGSNVQSNKIAPERTLGEPENNDTYNFLTMGYNGSITLGFGGYIDNETGNDFQVIETNFGGNGCGNYAEYVDVTVSQDNINFSEKITICSDDPEMDISDFGDYEWIAYIKFETYDVTRTTPDGYEIDGVISLNTCGNTNPPNNPTPATLCYATDVIEYVEGTTKSGGSLPNDRDNPLNATGAPQDNNSINFVTLGYGGSIVLGFNGAIINNSGNDFQIIETTYGSSLSVYECSVLPKNYKEYADVYVSQDGNDWHFIRTVCINDVDLQDPRIDISDADVDLDYINYVKIVNNDNLTDSGDGYEVDGIKILNCNN